VNADPARAALVAAARAATAGHDSFLPYDRQPAEGRRAMEKEYATAIAAFLRALGGGLPEGVGPEDLDAKVEEAARAG
jgi:hypothetical protein